MSAPAKSMTKRVLIVIESLSQGGAETAAVNLANGLAKRGNVVCVCAASGPLLPKLDIGVSFSELPRFGFSSFFKILITLHGIINRFKPDVIHSQNATHCLIVRLLFLFRIRPKLVFTYHSKKTTRIPNVLSGGVFNFIADRIIAIAEHRKQSLLRISVNPRKLYTIPNFIDAEKVESRRKSFDKKAFRECAGLGAFDYVLVTSARLIPAKNIDCFIRIVGRICKSGKNVAGVVLGDGPERLALEKVARQLNLDGKVLFTGFSEDVLSYCLASDVFVFPTKHPEVLPMALIEACAAGLPIVCSNIPGNDEIVFNGENGFLLNGDDLEYSAGILSLLNDIELRNNFSVNSLNIAKSRFADDVCISKTLGIYE